MHYAQTKTTLNQLVADLSQMAAVIHQTHWYMRGDEFLTLHPFMDKLMAEIDDQLDVVAERLITLDGAPFSTMAEWQQHTGIQDGPGDYSLTIPERLQLLLADYRYLASVYEQGIEVSGEEADYSTQDILIGCKTAIEKRIWMLSARLDRAPELDVE